MDLIGLNEILLAPGWPVEALVIQGYPSQGSKQEMGSQ